MLLSGKTAVISGAAGPRGIGYAAARLFAEHGARVAILDIDGNAAEAAAKGLGPDHLGLVCDVTDPEVCRRSVSAAIDRFGVIDILINNAGITQPLKFMDIDQVELAAHHRRQSDRRAQPHRRPSCRTCASASSRIDRLHVIGVGAARRRHLRRPALLGGQGGRPRTRQGDGARTGARQHSRQLRDPGTDPDRHHRRQADR
jgi:NAD(P)-dependent dehydrogenase (short-subunit alcohol dehydrogenase family)